MEPPRRRRHGLERFGVLSPERMGLPIRRGRELWLQRAWHREAGETLARWVRVLGVRRGVLEVEAADRNWYDAVAPLMGGLAGRLAALDPGIGIRKVRLRLQGDAGTPPAVAVTPSRSGTVRAPSAGPETPRPDRSVERPSEQDQAALLSRVRDRYLARGGERRPAKR